MPKRRSVSRGPYRPRRKTSAPKRRRPYYSNRRLGAYRGRGAYAAPKSAQIGADLGGYLGSAVGLIPGGKAFSGLASLAGAKIGGFLGNKLGKYMGWGSYHVKQNSLMVPEGNSPAAMHTDGSYVRISHREFISDIYASGSSNPTASTFQLNPGNSTVFPWLYAQALSYQKYKLLGAIIEFKSTTGNFSTATTANPNVGEVVISSNYNCADPPFTTRTAMENTQYCSSAKPSVSFVHIVECDPSLQAQENLYVVEGAVPRPQMSINECNWNQFTVATFGTQNTTGNVPFQVGSLYITYDILLIQPVDRAASVTKTSAYYNATSVNEPFPLGDCRSLVANTSNSLALELEGYPGWSGGTYNKITFPETAQGSFLISWISAGSAVGVPITLPAFANFFNCVMLSDYDMNNVGLNYGAPANGETSRACTLVIGIRVTGPKPSLTFGGGAFADTGHMRFIVTQIDTDLNGTMPS